MTKRTRNAETIEEDANLPGVPDPEGAAGSSGAPPADSAAAAGPGEVAESGVEAALVALDARLADQRDKYMRLAAEFDNFRKRSVRERQRAEHEGMAVLIRGILDALDDLGRFAHVDPGTTDARTVQEGAEMVEKKLLKHLAGHGLEVVDPVGRPFDPALHEAVMTRPAEAPEEDHIVAQVFQVGYLLNGQLVRAAKVVVQQWNG